MEFNSTAANATVTKGKGKAKAPPLPAAGKGIASKATGSKGKATGPPLPTAGKVTPGTISGEDCNKDTQGDLTSADSAEPTFGVVARRMDGFEFDLTVRSSDLGSHVRARISEELEIARSRIKLAAGEYVLGDRTSVGSCGLKEGDVINIIILSPLHGSLNRSGLNVPIDVMERKMELNDAFLAGVRLKPVAA